MPQSKHRRKAGGKSVKHPGRGKASRELPPSPAMLAWRTFSNAYCRPFHRQWPGHPAGELLDIVSAGLFDADMRIFHTVNKVEIFTAFLQPFEEEDGTSVTRTPARLQRPLDGADAFSAVIGQRLVRGVAAAILAQPLEQCLADVGFAIGDLSSPTLDLDPGLPDSSAFAA